MVPRIYTQLTHRRPDFPLPQYNGSGTLQAGQLLTRAFALLKLISFRSYMAFELVWDPNLLLLTLLLHLA